MRLAELALARPEVEALVEVERWYRAAAASAPENESLRARLVELYRKSGKRPELAQELRLQLEAAGPRAPLALALELARTLAELGDLAQASAVLQPAFEREPESAAAGDLLESLLAEQDRIEELCDVLAKRLARERDPARRRELAHRQAGLLLEGLRRAPDAVAVLREFADPTRDGRLEHLFARALEAGGQTRELEAWLAMREPHVRGAERTELLLRLASLHEGGGRVAEAIECLKRARTDAVEPLAATVRSALLALLRAHGSAEDQLAFLEESLGAAPDAASRAALLIERGRLYAERLHDSERALADLERAEREAELGPAELRLVAQLCAAAGAHARQVQALVQLAEKTRSPEERRATSLELARLCGDGPEAVRDPARAEEVLRRLLAQNGADPDAFDRLDRALRARRPRHPSCAGCSPSGSPRARCARASARRWRCASRGCSSARIKRGSPSRPWSTRARTAATRRSTSSSSKRWRPEATPPARCSSAAERARAAEPAERKRWLRRWLTALDAARQGPAERLAVLDRMLAEHAGDAELLALRLPLVREVGSPERVAEALEALLACPDAELARRAAPAGARAARAVRGPARRSGPRARAVRARVHRRSAAAHARPARRARPRRRGARARAAAAARRPPARSRAPARGAAPARAPAGARRRVRAGLHDSLSRARRRSARPRGADRARGGRARSRATTRSCSRS